MPKRLFVVRLAHSTLLWGRIIAEEDYQLVVACRRATEHVVNGSSATISGVQSVPSKITPKQLESAAKKNHVAQVIFAVLIQSFLYARAPAAPLPAGARNIKSL